MTVLHEWVIEPRMLRVEATRLMQYYRDHAAINAATGEQLSLPYYRAFQRAQTYIERMQDEGAQLVATDYEAWLPSQRDSSCHTVSAASCTCEGNRLNHVYCVHMAVYDLILSVMAGKNVRRI